MEWDPCGDDFGYAEKWSKQFIDANDFTEKYKTKSCLERANNGQGCTSRRTSRQIPKTTLFRKLARIQMSLKNNDVGRQVKYSLIQWTRDSRTNRMRFPVEFRRIYYRSGIHPPRRTPGVIISTVINYNLSIIITLR